MNILFGGWIVKFVGLSSKLDLDRIRINNGEILILGENFYGEDIFLLHVRSVNEITNFWVALYSYSGTIPSIIVGDEDNYMTIGYNQKVTVINLPVKRNEIDIELPHNFIFSRYLGKKLVVIYEVGILIFDENYKEVLNQPTDIIESFEFIENKLICNTSSGTHKVSL